MTRAERLATYAQAASRCFGSRWQSDASRHHGISLRTVQRWVALEQDVPDAVFVEIARLLSERAREALNLAGRIASGLDTT